MALGAQLPVQAVTMGEGLRRTVSQVPEFAGMPLWCAGMARRDRVFLERDGNPGPEAFMLEALPCPGQPVLLAGDASALVAAAIARTGGIARCSGIERADVRAIAAIGRDRLAGRLPSRPALPLYVDPPEAKAPAAGLRPAPA
jgi:hypothetical protein